MKKGKGQKQCLLPFFFCLLQIIPAISSEKNLF